MKDEWRKWAQAEGWSLDGDSFIVKLGGRQQRLRVVCDAGITILRSRVASRATLARIKGKDPNAHAWERNRVSELVGFRVDKHDVMQAETPLPEAVTRDEWLFLVKYLARSADRFEYLLSGRDED
jgi:hypothetical protein